MQKTTMMKEFMGRVITNIEGDVGAEEVVFGFLQGRSLKMVHDRECCESVYLAEVIGDLDDLINTPIFLAEMRVEEGVPEHDAESLWTFYAFRTHKGDVTLRWNGESNGYYSMSVDILVHHASDWLEIRSGSYATGGALCPHCVVRDVPCPHVMNCSTEF